MEDYEKRNARAWDIYAKPAKPRATTAPAPVIEEVDRPLTPPVRPLQNRRQATPSRKPSGSRSQDTSPRPIPLAHNKPSPNIGWQTVDGSKRQQTKRPQARFDYDRVSDAEASWRNGQPRSGQVQISEDLTLHNRYCSVIARQTGTFIFAETLAPKGGKITFDIWGAEAKVRDFKAQLDAWIQASRPETHTPETQKYTSDRPKKYAHVPSLTPKLRLREQRRWERDEARKEFRKAPPLGRTFGAIGSFLWPVAEYKPEDVLGPSYEALDPLRMDFKCYIIYNRARSSFQVMGKPEDVKKALLRLRAVCFQLAAKSIYSVRTYLLDWKDANPVPEFVRMDKYELPRTIVPMQEAPQVCSTPRGEGSSTDPLRLQLAERMPAINTKHIRDAFMQTLRKIRYLRGDFDMRIRLGTFLVITTKITADGRYTHGEYEDMVTESQFVGMVTRELSDIGSERSALSRLQKAGPLLIPQDAMTEKLEEVMPVYSVKFAIADEAGDLCLSMSWAEIYNVDGKSTGFEITSKKWSRIDSETEAPHTLLDISLTDLEDGSAWHFDISATKSVEEARLSEAHRAFANNLKIDPVAAHAARDGRDNSPFMIFYPYAMLKSLDQRLSYRYNLATSDYTLSLTRFQLRTYLACKSAMMTGGLIGRSPTTTLYEPRWSVEVYRTAWDTMLSKHERLPIGEAADWRADLATWFPEDLAPGPSDGQKVGKGFEQMMEKLAQIKELVRPSFEHLVGGMRVG